MADCAELLDELPAMIGCFGPDGVLSYVNRSYATYYATTPEALIGRSFLELVPAEFQAAVSANLSRLRTLRRDESTMIDVHQGGDADGDPRWFRWTNKALFDPGSLLPREFIAFGVDITEQVRAEQRTWYLATHDPLTGLINRHALQDELETLVDRAQQLGTSFGLLYLDLDGLKAVNDHYGHAAGDDLIKGAANALLASFRDTDIIGRIGGDEFVILCPGVEDEAELASMLERARGELERVQARLLTDVDTGISAGILLCTGEHTADTVLQNADQAMYDDKIRRRTAA